jgi:hypothetical protein
MFGMMKSAISNTSFSLGKNYIFLPLSEITGLPMEYCLALPNGEIFPRTPSYGSVPKIKDDSRG